MSERGWMKVDPRSSGLSADITGKVVKEVYGSRYQFLAEDALRRVSETNEYYRYYDLEGQYWEFPRTLGYNPTVMPANLARWFIRKRTGWMFEAAPDIECPPERIDTPEAMETEGYQPSKKQKAANDRTAAREDLLYRVWSDNHLEEKLLEAGRDYFIGGTVALKVRYLPGTGVRLNFVPAQEVFPVPNMDDPDVFDAVHFCSFLDNEKTLWKQTWEMVGERCLLTEGTYDLNLNPIAMTYNRKDTKLDFIPVLIFAHDRISGDIFGTSYLKDLIPIFDRFNRTMSDAADSLRFNLFAVTVLLNAAPDAEKKLKVSPGEIWNIGGDGLDVKKLESGFNYAAALQDFMTRLTNLMHLLADVPNITPDTIKGFGLVSGVALKLLYSDLVSATQQEWRVWKSRLSRMNEYILRMHETFNLEGAKYIKGNYANRIITHLPLPENEAERVATEAQKLAVSLQSVKGAMDNLGEKFPERKIAEIITERERFLSGGLGKRIDREEQALLSDD